MTSTRRNQAKPIRICCSQQRASGKLQLTEEQIKEDQEMAPVEDPDEKLDEAKKVLLKSIQMIQRSGLSSIHIQVTKEK